MPIARVRFITQKRAAIRSAAIPLARTIAPLYATSDFNYLYYRYRAPTVAFTAHYRSIIVAREERRGARRAVNVT